MKVKKHDSEFEELDDLIPVDSTEALEQLESWTQDFVRVGDALAYAKYKAALAETARKLGEARLYFGVRDEREATGEKVTEELLKKMVLVHEEFAGLVGAEASTNLSMDRWQARYEAMRGKRSALETLAYMVGAKNPSVDTEERDRKKKILRDKFGKKETP